MAEFVKGDVVIIPFRLMGITSWQDARTTVIIEYYRSGSVSLPRFLMIVFMRI